MVCAAGGDLRCSYCGKGYYLYQGECYSQCPQQTYPYYIQRVCLDKSIPNCITQQTQPTYYHFIKTTANQISDGLFYFTSVNFVLNNPLNDPQGSLFSYTRSSSRNDLQPKPITIASSHQICQQCLPSHGLDPQGNCSPCLPPCL